MDNALSSLDLGPLGTFLELRTPVLNSQGFVRKDCYEPYGIHLSRFGAHEDGLRINKLLTHIIKSTQVQVQTPPAAVSIPHPREAELASLWLWLRGIQSLLLSNSSLSNHLFLSLYHLSFHLPN